MYQVGQKVIGYWGAMHPYSYGKISEWNPKQSMKFVVQWDDGSEFHGRCSDIHYGNVGCAGIGVYFAQNEESLLAKVQAGDEAGQEDWIARAKAGEVMRIC